MRCADFGPTPGRQTQRINQTRERRCVLHLNVAQKGSFIRAAIHARHETGVLLLGARGDFSNRIIDGGSRRSSSIFLSSPSNFGSIKTFLASCRPFIVTLTMPAPDSPVTVDNRPFGLRLLHASPAFAVPERIRFPNPPFIIGGPSY